MKDTEKLFAIIPAAGLGLRFGSSTPKQYGQILGQPMIYYAISTLSANRKVESIYVVLSPSDKWFNMYDWGNFKKKLKPIYVGGKTRFDTVRNGLKKIECMDNDWILVHDAARPCLRSETLDNLVIALQKNRVGVVLSKKVTDTIKRSKGSLGLIEQTVSRAGLWHALTPQIFRYDILAKALDHPCADLITDESSAVEQLGLSPMLVESHTTNLKVTTADDLALATMLIEKCGGEL